MTKTEINLKSNEYVLFYENDLSFSRKQDWIQKKQGYMCVCVCVLIWLKLDFACKHVKWTGIVLSWISVDCLSEIMWWGIDFLLRVCTSNGLELASAFYEAYSAVKLSMFSPFVQPACCLLTCLKPVWFVMDESTRIKAQPAEGGISPPSVSEWDILLWMNGLSPRFLSTKTRTEVQWNGT